MSQATTQAEHVDESSKKRKAAEDPKPESDAKPQGSFLIWIYTRCPYTTWCGFFFFFLTFFSF